MFYFFFFFKIIRRRTFFGKGAQIDVVKYYVFWTTMNLFFANQIACWLYIAGADAIFAWIIAVSYVPAITFWVPNKIIPCQLQVGVFFSSVWLKDALVVTFLTYLKASHFLHINGIIFALGSAFEEMVVAFRLLVVYRGVVPR